MLDVVVLLAVAIPSVILHEVSHGWAALRLGDDTAKRKGRLTLNPIAHVDPVGTLLILEHPMMSPYTRAVVTSAGRSSRTRSMSNPVAPSIA